MRAAGLEPLEPYRSAGALWRFRCLACGRELATRYDSVARGVGCRYCAQRGMDYTAPGVVYVMVNTDFQAVKVGVTTTAARTDRVGAHERNGWVAVRSWDVPSADDAIGFEREVLSWWRTAVGAPPAMLPGDMPQGGASETASLMLIELEDTAEFIQRAVDRLYEQ